MNPKTVLRVVENASKTVFLLIDFSVFNSAFANYYGFASLFENFVEKILPFFQIILEKGLDFFIIKWYNLTEM